MLGHTWTYDWILGIAVGLRASPVGSTAVGAAVAAAAGGGAAVGVAVVSIVAAVDMVIGVFFAVHHHLCGPASEWGMPRAAAAVARVNCPLRSCENLRQHLRDSILASVRR